MTKEEIINRLQPVFRDVFDDRRIKVNQNTNANDIIGWDSLTHIQLLAATEDEFSIKFAVEDVASLKNVGELVDIILKTIEKN